MKTRIGTRKSKLALTQANLVGNLIKNQFSEIEIEYKKIVTKGDKILDAPLAKIGGKGLFVKEIEEALMRNEIDIAVHSAKDVPMEIPDDLEIACVPHKEDCQDVLISKDNIKFSDLKKGAKIGTSSLRRICQILNKRPDLKIENLRGNLDTRIRKLKEGQYDAIVVAYAGLKRLGLKFAATEIFEENFLMPAVGQGLLALEIRKKDSQAKNICEKLNIEKEFIKLLAGRAFLSKLGGSCQIPIGFSSKITDESLELKGLVGSIDGKKIIKKEITGVLQNHSSLGETLAINILSSEAKKILEELSI